MHTKEQIASAIRNASEVMERARLALAERDRCIEILHSQLAEARALCGAFAREFAIEGEASPAIVEYRTKSWADKDI